MPFAFRFSLPMTLLVASAVLTGCSTFQEEWAEHKDRQESITQVVGDTWRMDAVWPWEDRPIKLREYMNEKAQWHCQSQGGKGAMLIDAVSQKRTNGAGSEGLLIFRCVGELPSPARPFWENQE